MSIHISGLFYFLIGRVAGKVVAQILVALKGDVPKWILN